MAVPPSMMGNGDHFALEVEGESMIEAGIMDGDIVVIRKANTARNNEIVVALVDQDEATLFIPKPAVFLLETARALL